MYILTHIIRSCLGPRPFLRTSDAFGYPFPPLRAPLPVAMSGYASVLASVHASVDAALSGLPLKFRGALLDAGLREAGTLAELLELEEAELA